MVGQYHRDLVLGNPNCELRFRNSVCIRRNLLKDWLKVIGFNDQKPELP